MPSGHAVDGIGVLGNLNFPARQLISKAYRPRSRCPWGRGERRDLLGEIRGGRYERLPETLATGRVERREDLAAAGVEHGQAATQRPTERIERANAGGGRAGAGRQPTRRGEANADADERAGAAAGREQSHPGPAAAGLDRTLDLTQQGRRVARTAIGREPKPLFMQHRAVACDANDRIRGRRVEADDRLSLGAQVSP